MRRSRADEDRRALCGDRGAGSDAPLLRSYEAQGLVRPVRTANGYPRYDDCAARTVRPIRGLLTAGLSTDGIRHLLPCANSEAPDLEPCQEVLTPLRGRSTALDERNGTLAGAPNPSGNGGRRRRRRTSSCVCAPGRRARRRSAPPSKQRRSRRRREAARPPSSRGRP
ncbi:MerR family transcriptional regulator [Blastococcus sp. SYSU DS0616]